MQRQSREARGYCTPIPLAKLAKNVAIAIVGSSYGKSQGEAGVFCQFHENCLNVLQAEGWHCSRAA